MGKRCLLCGVRAMTTVQHLSLSERGVPPRHIQMSDIGAFSICKTWSLAKGSKCMSETVWKHLRVQSVNSTMTPGLTISANSSASQFVRRMHPCDPALSISDGSGVPWIP